MIESTLALARQSIRDLKPYSSARSLTTKGAVFLDANENPWGEYNRYPEPQPHRLRSALAELYNTKTEEIFLGRGADDAIDALVRTFCEAREDAILICPPTYGMYQVAADTQGAAVLTAPTSVETGFAIDADAVISQWNSSVKLIFLCSPNNPTGNLVEDATLDKILKAMEGRAVVVVDEAYLEFSGEGSGSRKLPQSPNLVVLRTLSKAWGLAGVRCGVALAHPKIIELLQKVRAPYPMSAPSIAAALQTLTPERRIEVERRTALLIHAREQLATELQHFSFVEKVYPSRANFLLVKMKSAPAIMEICRSRGIILRDRSRDLGLSDCVRITVGSETENALLLETLGGLPRGL